MIEGLFRGNSWNRTNDTSIFSAVLYQLSYVAGVFFVKLPMLFSGFGVQSYEKSTAGPKSFVKKPRRA